MTPEFLQNRETKITLLPEYGGKISSWIKLPEQREYLWFSPELAAKYDPTGEYDPQFCGGIDELLPSDLPETVDGILYPDHGELWRTKLDFIRLNNTSAILSGELPVSGLSYRREMYLDGRILQSKVAIRNHTDTPRYFMWKLHAAFPVRKGDQVVLNAGVMQAADVAWSLLPDACPRQFGGVYTVPEPDGGSEFLYLTDLRKGEMCLNRVDGGSVICRFDRQIFSCAWLFASYGKLNGSKTIVLEPCTNYPALIAEARHGNCCAKLQGHQSLETTIEWEIR